jgi:hypothetical protein
MPDITIQQLLYTPTITRLVSRIKTPLALFQSFYGLLPGSPASETVASRSFAYEIFNATRQIASVRAPGAGPARAKLKALGQVSGTVIRSHEVLHIQAEQIRRFRPMGANYGTLDTNGQNFIAKQVAQHTQKFRNLREFMVSRMFRGGFSVTADGDDWTLGELAAAGSTYDVNFQVPSTNLNFLPMGSGNANLITDDWSDPTAPIHLMLYAIRQAFERLHGYPLVHIWMHPEDLAIIQQNVNLQNIVGSSNKVFDTMTGRTMSSEEGIPDTGYDIVFGALPLFRFHAYGGGLNLDGTDSTAYSSFNTFIPRGYAIMTPAPGPWIGYIAGTEFVRESYMDAGGDRVGFTTWHTDVIDPAGVDLKFLDNGIPALYNPACVAFAKVMPSKVGL